MSRSSVGRDASPTSGLSPGAALAVLVLMDASLDAFCASAPRAVAEFGGSEALRASCRMTCVGLVPSLPNHSWEGAAAEHADAQHLAMRDTGRGAAGSFRPGAADHPVGRFETFAERLAEALR